MDLKGLLTAVEDIFYDFVAWIAMYPRTLIWAFFNPGRARQYVTEEFGRPQADRFQAYLNPFIFWFLSMVLFMWSVTTEALTFTFEAFVLTMVLFAMLPAIMAALMLRAQKAPFTRDGFRRPLYIQMLLFGAAQTILSLALSVTEPMVQLGEGTSSLFATLAILVVYLLWFSVLGAVLLWIPFSEVRVFTKELDRPFGKVIGWVLLGLLLCGLLIGLMPVLSSEIDLVAGMMRFTP